MKCSSQKRLSVILATSRKETVVGLFGLDQGCDGVGGSPSGFFDSFIEYMYRKGLDQLKFLLTTVICVVSWDILKE